MTMWEQRQAVLAQSLVNHYALSMPTLTRLVVLLASVGNAGALANARAATTDLCARRLEREAVSAYVAEATASANVAAR